MTFTSWLKHQRRRHDPVGDLARDVARDKCWPQGEPGELTHLAQHHAMPAVYTALRRAWDEFVRDAA
jgi:hypothetical protein